jgi:hypothetical protein
VQSTLHNVLISTQGRKCQVAVLEQLRKVRRKSTLKNYEKTMPLSILEVKR